MDLSLFSSIMQIQETLSGSPVPPELSKKAVTELPTDFTVPSGLEEKLPADQREVGRGKKKRIAFDLDVKPLESPAESMFCDSNVREANDEVHEGGTLQSHSRKKQTCPESQTIEPTTEVGQLQKKLANYLNSLCTEFRRRMDNLIRNVQELQDRSDTEFTALAVNVFFNESKRHIGQIARALNQEIVDFSKVDKCAQILMGSSAMIGAERLKETCIHLSRFCKEKNRQACLECLKQMENDYFLTKCKLETLLKLEKQIVAAGGPRPMTKHLRK